MNGSHGPNRGRANWKSPSLRAAARDEQTATSTCNPVVEKPAGPSLIGVRIKARRQQCRALQPGLIHSWGCREQGCGSIRSGYQHDAAVPAVVSWSVRFGSSGGDSVWILRLDSTCRGFLLSLGNWKDFARIKPE